MQVMVRWLALALVPAVLAAQQDTAFSTASEAKLDSLYGPLVYLMKADERGRYGTLKVEGKRSFLRQFWKRRDPKAMTSYYERVATVNRLFREGGAAEIPGWRTDRGRIYLKYGPPSAVLHRPQPPSANPYEVWRYEKQRLLKFVFLDLTRFGNYALIWTNDRAESVRPDWYLLLGPDAVEDAMRF
jgi:GWxTD domain-containing protein